LAIRDFSLRQRNYLILLGLSLKKERSEVGKVLTPKGPDVTDIAAGCTDGLVLLWLKRADKPIRAPLLDPLQAPVDLLQFVTEVGAHLRDERGG
jgi:hypothetical protein